MSFNPTRWQIRSSAELGEKLRRLAERAGLSPEEYVRRLVETAYREAAEEIAENELLR